MTNRVQIKRAYDAPANSDGYRVLVDRLWPRGISKQTLHHDQWCKDLAPSTDLRKWFDHKPERWEKFHEDYLAELATEQATKQIDEILAATKSGKITLLYGAKDTEHNQAVVLAELMNRRDQHAH
ncbi:MAG: DUF488 domain-containing protein [Castellaniella sp.]|uniref:DUF488 domain-containing protein n=1 Tax=Castellaniella sp. TaxID=1955812 RepID=UPI003A91EC30